MGVRSATGKPEMGETTILLLKRPRCRLFASVKTGTSVGRRVHQIEMGGATTLLLKRVRGRLFASVRQAPWCVEWTQPSRLREAYKYAAQMCSSPSVCLGDRRHPVVRRVDPSRAE